MPKHGKGGGVPKPQVKVGKSGGKVIHKAAKGGKQFVGPQ